MAAVAVLACPGQSSATVLPAGFEEHTVAHHLIDPTAVAWAPDGRMFVAEKAGRVQVYGPDGTRAASPVVDVSDHVVNLTDRGLTGIALDRDFATNGYLYLLYAYKANPTASDPQVWRLSRVTVQPDDTLANPTDPETVLLGTVTTAPCPPPDNASDCIASDNRNHQGGTVRSDPTDGTLWVGFGDDTQFDVQDPHAFRTYDEQSFAGKILHIDRNGRGLPGHPFCPADTDLTHVCTKVYAKGFRNPFRFSLRPGGVIAADVGSRTFEEVDLVSAGGDYGWPCYEGTVHTPEYADDPDCATEYAKEGTAEAARPPVYEYPHDGANSSITGGPVYAGDQFPSSYAGVVFFGDYVKGTLGFFRLGAGDQLGGMEPFGRALGAPVDIELAPDGSLALVDIGYGAVREISYVGGRSEPAGGLELAGCVAESLPGCDQLSVSGALDGMNGLAISPNDRNLYGVAIGSGTLDHFSLDAGGDPQFRGCISATAAGCTGIGSVDAMRGTHTVTLSPDGTSAYTASDTTGTVEHFQLDQSGDPTFVDCTGHGRTGCAEIGPDALRGAHTGVISADGRQLYVTAIGRDAVVQFSRDPGTGSLTFTRCYARAVTGCTNLGTIGALDDPHDAKLSPDGTSMYVPGYAGDTLSHFTRDPATGDLTFDGCIGEGATGCSNLSPIDALDGLHGIAVSPDGDDLYGAAGLSGTLSHFRVDPSTGALSFAGCIGRAAEGCAAFPGNGLEGAHWVTVSPDGRSVYVAARESSAVTSFARDPATGDLTYRGCVAQGAGGCLNLSPVEALGGEVDWVQLSSDSRTLYTTSFGGDGLARFRVGDGTASLPAAGGTSAGSGRRFAVTVRIRGINGSGAVTGKVRSAETRCVARAKVSLLRGPGALVLKARANRTGRFRLRTGGRASGDTRLFVRVKAKELAGGDFCKSARSAVFRIPARG